MKIDSRVAAGIVSVAGGLYLAVHLRNGWFPWDAGSLGVTAERAMMGELPHRDFPDLYTGGLTFLHAAAFRILGVDLLSPRIVLLFAFAAWLAVLYLLASRFLPKGLSAMVVALGVVWSVPNYPAPVPSWYNLFFATAGLLAIVNFSDDAERKWAWLAGICAGLSISAKITGLFVAVGAAVFFVFYEQTRPEQDPAKTESRSYSALVFLFSVGLLLAVTRLVMRAGGAGHVFRFVAPMGALVSVLVIEEWRRLRSGGTLGSRYASIFKPAAAFLVGMSIPLLILALPYIVSGSLADLLDGVLIRPARRLDYAVRAAPSMLSLIPTLAVACTLALGLRLRPAHRWIHAPVLVLIGTAVLVVASFSWMAYAFVWFSAYQLTPLVIIAGCVWIVRTPAPVSDRRRIFALLSITAGVGFVQFPYASSLYFLYSAALVFLTLAALAWQIGAARLPSKAVGIPVFLYFAFGAFLMNPHPPVGAGPGTSGQRWAELALPRASLRSSPEDSLVYGELVQIIRAHADRRLGFAGPDAPEVYFLTGSSGRAGALFDFFEETAEGGSSLDDPEYLSGFDLIVLNHAPQFSPAVSPETLERLSRQFPGSASAGHFEVRWRE